jgi:predicted glycoside hydrolase/deacetylase ChbG (UPF0249 family)
MPTTRYLALCADDFGLHDGINRAAIQLAHRRRITAISCLVAAPAWREQRAALREIDATQVDVGLHLDLTQYTVSTSKHRSLPRLILSAYAGTLSLIHIRDEMHAQLDAFETALGRAPSHIDGHRHVHQLPMIRDILFDILQRRYPTQRPWVRVALPPRMPSAARANAFKPWLIGQLGGRQIFQLTRARGQPHNARLLGVYDFTASVSRYQQLLTNWLQETLTGDLLMCHPSAEHSDANDPILPVRICEWMVLAGAAFANMLAENGITLVPMSRILAMLDQG